MRRRSGVAEMMSGFQDLRAGYQLGKESRFTSRLRGVDPMGSGADYHNAEASEFYQAIERARDYDRNNLIASTGIDRAADSILQDGLCPDPETGNPDVDTYISRRWTEWGDNPYLCDVRHILTLPQIAKMVLRHTYIDGDVVLLPLKLGSLQAIEAHRLVTPYNTKKNVIHGVQINIDTGAPEKYYIVPESSENYRAIRRVKDAPPIDAVDKDGERQVFHIYNPKRFSQTRGVSVFNAISYALGMHDDLQFAHLVKAQQAACSTILVERDVNYAGGPIVQTGSRIEQENADGTTRTLESTHAGARLYGEIGEHFTGYSPNIPNPEFFQHAAMIIGFISACLGLPAAVLLLDPKETNFSGWRGSIDQARIGFRNIQAFMRVSFYSPVYRWKIRQWLATDRVFARLVESSGADPFGVKWKAPRWPYIEPMKDAQADSWRIEHNLDSRTRVLGERGADWDEVAPQIVADEGQLVEFALIEARRLNGAFPEANLDWRELIHLTAPATATTAADNAANAEPDDADVAEADERRKTG